MMRVRSTLLQHKSIRSRRSRTCRLLTGWLFQGNTSLSKHISSQQLLQSSRILNVNIASSWVVKTFPTNSSGLPSWASLIICT